MPLSEGSIEGMTPAIRKRVQHEQLTALRWGQTQQLIALINTLPAQRAERAVNRVVDSNAEKNDEYMALLKTFSN